MSTNIVYKKPARVRLRPRDIGTQTEPIRWVQPPSNVQPTLRFSKTFIDYLKSDKFVIDCSKQV